MMSFSLPNPRLLAARVLLLLAALAAWELGARSGAIDPFFFSSPVRVVERLGFWVKEGVIWPRLVVTLAEVGAGFTVGCGAGLLAGFGLAASPRLDALFQPALVVLNAFPRVALAPLLMMVLGLSFTAAVAVVVSVVAPIAFFNAHRGYREVSPAVLRHARVLGATRGMLFWHVHFPASAAWTFASLRSAAGLATASAVLAEYLGAGAGQGIGSLIDNAQANFDATGVMGGLAALTVMVVILDLAVRKIERAVCRWRVEDQHPAEF